MQRQQQILSMRPPKHRPQNRIQIANTIKTPVNTIWHNEARQLVKHLHRVSDCLCPRSTQQQRVRAPPPYHTVPVHGVGVGVALGALCGAGARMCTQKITRDNNMPSIPAPPLMSCACDSELSQKTQSSDALETHVGQSRARCKTMPTL